MALQGYVGEYKTEWGHFAAGALIVSAPVMALFFALQKLPGGRADRRRGEGVAPWQSPPASRVPHAEAAMRTLILFSILSASMAWADGGTKSDCTVKREKDDKVSKNADLVIQAGEKVHDAIAIDGNLTLKAGAHVHDAIAFGGTLTVEDGAVVEGSVVVFGGKAKVSPRAVLKGSRLELGDSLKVVGESGDRASVKVEVGGENLSAVVAAAALKELRGCKVE